MMMMMMMMTMMIMMMSGLASYVAVWVLCLKRLRLFLAFVLSRPRSVVACIWVATRAVYHFGFSLAWYISIGIGNGTFGSSLVAKYRCICPYVDFVFLSLCILLA